MNVLGETHVDIISQLLNTGYERFSSPTGINGLAQIIDGGLDILAVDAGHPGTGQFREFIHQCKIEFDQVVIWEVWNEMLPEVLQRYGFVMPLNPLKGPRSS